jgi:glucodextranase-like protein
LINTRKLFTLPLSAILVLAACSPTPTISPVAVPSHPTTTVIVTQPQATATAAPPVVGQASPTAVSQPTQTSEAVVAQPLYLQVTSPQDGDTVNTSQVDVVGSAPTGATVSVNDDIIIVGNNQQFKSTVALDEGPNLIEIIASDDSGNETSLELTVTYEP